MPMPNKKGWFAVFFIIFTLSIPFAITYYASTDSYKAKYQNRQPQITQSPKPSFNNLVLIKNQKTTINRTCLVFKGLSGETVHIDLYLLELDPETPYPLKFSRQSVRDGIWIEDIRYQALSVKENILKLKILDETFE